MERSHWLIHPWIGRGCASAPSRNVVCGEMNYVMAYSLPLLWFQVSLDMLYLFSSQFPQVDAAFEVFANNNITLDLPLCPQPDTCVYDMSPSCKEEFPWFAVMHFFCPLSNKWIRVPHATLLKCELRSWTIFQKVSSGGGGIPVFPQKLWRTHRD